MGRVHGLGRARAADRARHWPERGSPARSAVTALVEGSRAQAVTLPVAAFAGALALACGAGAVA
ncbi:hypothetical protein OG311_28675 [Streptomyces sp. NBC_01343]|uniref:hypothetical protein n=1 Tax=Streptomyces sp. NBC_01343 TaxID=2903832 RepID=UPI002E1548BC|nr:hypothetical protein OG311_28675 [Streptomyces sp. NBC_01343]